MGFPVIGPNRLTEFASAASPLVALAGIAKTQGERARCNSLCERSSLQRIMRPWRSPVVEFCGLRY